MEKQVLLNRVNRIKGQVEGVGNMVSESRYCADILQQTAAIHAALRALESAVLEDHIRTCVHDAAIRGGAEYEQKIAELMRIYKKLEGGGCACTTAKGCCCKDGCQCCKDGSCAKGECNCCPCCRCGCQEGCAGSETKGCCCKDGCQCCKDGSCAKGECDCCPCCRCGCQEARVAPVAKGCCGGA